MKEFWRKKRLDEMDRAEWEALCDGCGLCCLHKLEDEDTGEYHFTNLACRLLDPETCRCKDYRRRFQQVPDCLPLRPLDVGHYGWLPSTCAYRRLAGGLDLPDWHPLITGDPESVHRAGISARGRCVSEIEGTDQIEEHFVDWIK